MSNSPIIYIVAEHCGVELKQYLIQRAAQNRIKIIDLYLVNDPTDDYPTVAKILAKRLRDEPNSVGIAMCGSGQGINMCLNRFYFIRSALIDSTALARQAREHGGANVITFGAKYIKPQEAWNCLELFLSVEPSVEARHLRRTTMFGREDYTKLD